MLSNLQTNNVKDTLKKLLNDLKTENIFLPKELQDLAGRVWKASTMVERYEIKSSREKTEVFLH